MLLTMAACGSKNTDTDTDTKTGSEKKQLVVATSPDFPPFESLDGSDIVGNESKLMKAIADKLGMEWCGSRWTSTPSSPASRPGAMTPVWRASALPPTV